MRTLRRLRRRTRRRWRRIRYSRHFRPVFRIVVWGGGGLVVLGAVWLVITGLAMKNQLSDLNDRISRVKELVASGEVAQAEKLARDIPDMARRAHHLTTGPAWWIASHVPYLGDPLEVARGTTSALDGVGTKAIPQLLTVADNIDPQGLRPNGRTIRIGPLSEATTGLRGAGGILAAAQRQLEALPTDTWLGPVDDRRALLVAQLRSIRGYVDAAARVSKALPDLLGEDGVTRRYFIGLQNEAEMRGTGGLPGAFAIARARNGVVTFERFESDAILLPAKTKQMIPTGLDFGAAYDHLYGPGKPTSFIVNSNSSPHFPYAAQIWAAMWQKVSGQRIDGALAVDPTALGYFLLATGPTSLPGGEPLTAANVVALTQKDNYARFPDNERRKAFLVAILKAASRKLLSGAGNAYSIVEAASLSARQHRLLAWSRIPKVQRLLEQTSYAGSIPSHGRPFGGMVLNNAAAGKLDYYLGRSMEYVRTGCGSRRDVTATMTLTNNAPANGLPPYVVSRLDQLPPGAQPGDNHVYLDYYATGGALLQSVTVDGQPAAASATNTLGQTVFRLDLQLPRGTATTVVLHLDEPAGKGRPRIWRQPGVNPLALKVDDQSCGR